MKLCEGAYTDDIEKARRIDTKSKKAWDHKAIPDPTTGNLSEFHCDVGFNEIRNYMRNLCIAEGLIWRVISCT